jgi:copper chaperone CopZ
MCSNAIRKSLQSLDFVQTVTANIKQSTFEVSFKEGTAVDFDKMKAAVEDAGFFVARFYATVNFNKAAAANDSHITVDGRTFHFMNVKGQLLDGAVRIRLLDKGFVSSKEFKRNGASTKMACYQTGMASTCCEKSGLPAGTRIFHVTI